MPRPDPTVDTTRFLVAPAGPPLPSPPPSPGRTSLADDLYLGAHAAAGYRCCVRPPTLGFALAAGLLLELMLPPACRGNAAPAPWITHVLDGRLLLAAREPPRDEALAVICRWMLDARRAGAGRVDAALAAGELPGWLEVLAGQAARLVQQRLHHKGLLHAQVARRGVLARLAGRDGGERVVYEPVDSVVTGTVPARLARTIADGGLLSGPDLALAGVLRAAGMLRVVLPDVEREHRHTLDGQLAALPTAQSAVCAALENLVHALASAR